MEEILQFKKMPQYKNAVFITTKNIDYIRNTQEIKLLNNSNCELKIIYSKRKKYIGRIFEIYIYLLFHSLKAYDLVFIGFSPQLILPFWSKKFSGKIWIDFFISMHDTFINDRKIFKEYSIISKLLKKLDIITLEKAGNIIVDTKEHGYFFAEEYGAKIKKMQVLYLQADKSFFYPRKVSKPEEVEGKYVVLYFGSVLPLQGVDVVLNAAKLCELNENIHFIMIGPLGKLKKFKKEDYKNITFYDWLTQEELADKIALSDLCLAGHFNRTIGKAKRTIAGKTYIYKSMGKPVVLGDNLANKELYEEDNINNYFVPMGDSKAIARIIKECARRWATDENNFDKSTL